MVTGRSPSSPGAAALPEQQPLSNWPRPATTSPSPTGKTTAQPSRPPPRHQAAGARCVLAKVDITTLGSPHAYVHYAAAKLAGLHAGPAGCPARFNPPPPTPHPPTHPRAP